MNRPRFPTLLLRRGLALALFAPSLAIALDRDAYRDDLAGLMRVVADIRTRIGPDAPGSGLQIDRATEMFGDLTDRQVDALHASLPAARLHAIVTESQRLLQAPPAATRKTAVVSEPDVSPAFCNDYPAPVALAALGTKLVTRFVIESLEFTCSESVPPGVNSALACEAPEIAAASADVASRLADFCGNQQSAAANEAVLETERSVGRHLETQLDAPLSTRATQVSIDAAATVAASSAARVGEVQDRLDQDHAQISAQIASAIDDLDDLAGELSDIQSRTDDIAFRVQVVQTDVEDAQIRGADLQAKAHELETTLASGLALATTADADATSLASSIAAIAQQQRRDDLAAALGDPDGRNAAFALAAGAGGNLEEAREVLIAAITALQSLGQGDPASALTLLASGDQHYNAGRYTEAWREFSAAYRALDPRPAPARKATP